MILRKTYHHLIPFVVCCWVCLYSCQALQQHHQQQPTTTRRRFLGTAVITTTAAIFPTTPPQAAQAGEIGTRITQAVTQSDLGIAVRRSVIQGAQTMDRIDGQWERFSDRFALGNERSRRPGRPEPIIIPDPRPLDTTMAVRILQCTDQTFLELLRPAITPTQLSQQIQTVADTVKPAFVRASLLQNPAQQFNFDLYVHFKAYSDLFIQLSSQSDNNSNTNSLMSFSTFLLQYQSTIGKEIVQQLLNVQSSSPQTLSLQDKLDTLDQLGQAFVQRGWIAQVEHTRPNPEQIQDWLVEDSNDFITWTMALNGDITLNAQLLLQEQGFRLYPNFAKWAVQSILGTSASTVDDYYMDTDYNSDPDKFQVKQVLLNIQLEGR